MKLILNRNCQNFPKLSVRCSAETVSKKADTKNNVDFRKKVKPIKPGSSYPAKEYCSNCGLCDTYFINFVNQSCAFLDKGMSKTELLEEQVHGRKRLENEDEELLGVNEKMLYAKNKPAIKGAQWTGIVTQIAIEMLQSKKVDAVVCVQGAEHDRFKPSPLVATSVEDIIKARGVKPSLSPNLNVLATVEALNVKKLLFIGVGCQVQALRSIEPYLNVDKLYVLGTNCVDNGTSKGFEKFRNAASESPDTVLHYEFMQDYNVHIKHEDGHFEYIPYFSLPANNLNDAIAKSCYSCFDYVNYLADIVVGYMGVPYENKNMTSHNQFVTIRNEKGREMFDSVAKNMEISEVISKGQRKQLVNQTVMQDDEAKMGKGPKSPMPKWLGRILAKIILNIGPQGIEFAKYSIEYHYIRNFIHVNRYWSEEKAKKHIPKSVLKIIDRYGGLSGFIGDRLKLKEPEQIQNELLKQQKKQGAKQ